MHGALASATVVMLAAAVMVTAGCGSDGSAAAGSSPTRGVSPSSMSSETSPAVPAAGPGTAGASDRSSGGVAPATPIVPSSVSASQPPAYSGAGGVGPSGGAAVDRSDPASVLAAFESAWCPFRWDEAPAVRQGRAAVFTTAAGAATLGVDDSWWQGQIVPNRTVATCSDVRVFQVDAPNDATRVVLRVTATRTSTDTATGGTATAPVTDQRVLLADGGHWLVDAPVEGG